MSLLTIIIPKNDHWIQSLRLNGIAVVCNMRRCRHGELVEVGYELKKSNASVDALYSEKDSEDVAGLTLMVHLPNASVDLASQVQSILRNNE